MCVFFIIGIQQFISITGKVYVSSMYLLNFDEATKFCRELGGHLPRPMNESELIYINREWQDLVEAVPSLRNGYSNYYFLDAKQGARSWSFRQSNGFKTDLYSIEAFKVLSRNYKGCTAVKSYLGKLAIVNCIRYARVLCELNIRHQKR